MTTIKLENIPLDKIDISLSNVRKTNLEKGIDELANSIKEIDVQQPVVVFRKSNGRFELVIGQRRYLACKKLKLEEIPAIITTVKNATEAMIISFSENIHRLELEYEDKMQVALELFNKFDGSINKVAERIGVSPQTVRNYLGYAAVPDSIKKMVEDEKLSVSTATQIIKNIPNEEKAVKIAEKVMEEPRGKQRRAIIDIARENPGKSSEDIVRMAKERSNLTSITINVTQKIYQALIFASKEYQSEKENVIKEALEEWLKKRGFIE